MTSPAITSPDRTTRLLQWGAAIGGLALVGALMAQGSYLVTVLAIAVIYGIFVTGLNFFMGYAGQISFGQNAFAAIGGYGSAILCGVHGWDPALALVASMLLAMAVAAVVGYPTLRLRGHYLAMATLALGLISYEVSVQWESLTEGYMGLGGIPPLGIAGLRLHGDRQQLAALLVLLLFGLWLSQRMRQSRFGRALSAIAGSEDAARALGIPVPRYKLAAFLIAAAYAAASGSLYAHFVGFISPEVFGPQVILWTLTMIYLGGVGTVWGPALGALIVALLPEAFRGFKELQDLIYCVALVIILIFAPNGLMAFLAALLRPRVRV